MYCVGRANYDNKIDAACGLRQEVLGSGCQRVCRVRTSIGPEESTCKHIRDDRKRLGLFDTCRLSLSQISGGRVYRCFLRKQVAGLRTKLIKQQRLDPRTGPRIRYAEGTAGKDDVLQR